MKIHLYDEIIIERSGDGYHGKIGVVRGRGPGRLVRIDFGDGKGMFYYNPEDLRHRNID